MPVMVRGVDATGVEFLELTKTLSISANGACIASTHSLRPDLTISLTFPAPSPASSSMVPSETPPVTARLRSQSASGDLRLLGLEFLRPLE
ncbi:MAG: hypothetical protein LAN71_00600 [Acidobacteriia bacterium]|nr:hypothetical protein [Terriglobia bacterium]